jgi:hypothetical protein
MNWEIRAFLNPKGSAQNPQPLYLYLTTLWHYIWMYVVQLEPNQYMNWDQSELFFFLKLEVFCGSSTAVITFDSGTILCVVQLHQNLCRSVVPSIAYIPWNSHVPSSLVCGSYWRVLRHSSTTWVPRSSLWISSRFGRIYHDCHHHLMNRDPSL